MKETVESRLKRVILDNSTVREEDIRPEARFEEDLGLDSLDVIEVVLAIEDEFGVDLSDEVVESWATVGDVLKWLEAEAL